MNRHDQLSFDPIIASMADLALAERSELPGQIDLALPAAGLRPPLSAALRRTGCRHALVFAEDRTEEDSAFYLYDVFDHPGDHRYLILRYPVPPDAPGFPAIAADAPALNWMEREIQDWFGLEAEGHPNPRRVALHDHWPAVNPLRKNFPLDTVLPPFSGEPHIFRPTFGEGVYQIPVGPVHAGIIEPGHFNFAVAGEPVLYLQIRLFYTHKGTEKRFEHLPASHAVFLAESVSGDSSFSHGLAFCQALEKIARIDLPDNARWGRTLFLELERLYNHVADIGAIATDVGFGIANAHASRLRECLLRLNEELSGSRLIRGVVCPGGLRNPIPMDALAEARRKLDLLQRNFEEMVGLIESSDSTIDRLERTGVLRPEQARDLGIVGMAARASGQDLDVRRDHPFAAYGQIEIHVPVFEQGDVLRRLRVRVEEARQSFQLIRTATGRISEGPWSVALPPLPAGRTALSAVEGWRGEILYWVRTGPGQTLSRVKVKDPSLNNWPALVEAVHGNIVPDFPVINKSFNLSYSGTDR